ncbi:tRNA pseudouridine32 synthase/23S rRNA pseudouridine746 synthase [Silvimonas terrae]|uniref:tRNA pseudouridine32 synthase/23S rRNA pseudouridine746 synthase n=1 Tax=Silvimonas terrae TaxID=300266 RepID=A0A840RIQ3_9NEIS|nr:pseudouridine synthase [Silvimonas terrae]MBB5192340.1 tRNA pseudouridine32 synthase/23S rRNA pseudouridine746 synthase [Silvimonas terrae]
MPAVEPTLSCTDFNALSVLYAHDDFLLVYKPAGLGFHREGDEAGVMDLLRAQHEGALYPLHRLDRITSGLLLVARSSGAARGFGERFATRGLEKFYLALSARKPAKKQGTIAGGMQSGRGGNWLLTRDTANYAVTQFFSYGLGDGLRGFLLRPRSGRTHQLRVALKSVGAPILGDTRYGGDAADRGYLHAYALRFEWAGTDWAFRLLPGSGTQWPTAWPEVAVPDLQSPWDLPWPVTRDPHPKSA